MKCSYCDYETSSLTDADCDIEIEQHTALEHPVATVFPPGAGFILEMHLKYQVPIDDLIAKIRDIREKMGQENRKEYQGEAAK